MQNLLLIIVVLFIGIAIVLPLAERFAKPIDEKQAAGYSKIIMILMALLLLASTIKYFTG